MNPSAGLPLRRPVRRWLPTRFVKFGTVGASGTLINLGMLYLGQEHLFAAIRSSGTRLNISLGLAIFCATVNNFGWNRGWTWGDRRQIKTRPLLQQFGQYALACWLGILLQALFTKVLTAHCHYLIANVVAIGLAGIFNFTVNDLWTFAGLKRWFPVREGKAGPNVPEDADV